MKFKNRPLIIGALGLGLLSTVTIASAKAVTLSDGRAAFNRPPNLVEVTTLDHSSVGSGRYHFVIEVPSDAGEPLGAVVITPLDRANRIAFNLDASEAELAPAYARGPMVPLASVGGTADNSGELLVAFKDPVQPGETVTVTLNTVHNPWGGVYQFEVTGYPAGENGVGQYLGIGRIQIYDPSN
jgi:hypothetical protein